MKHKHFFPVYFLIATLIFLCWSREFDWITLSILLLSNMAIFTYVVCLSSIEYGQFNEHCELSIILLNASLRDHPAVRDIFENYEDTVSKETTVFNFTFINGMLFSQNQGRFRESLEFSTELLGAEEDLTLICGIEDGCLVARWVSIRLNLNYEEDDDLVVFSFPLEIFPYFRKTLAVGVTYSEFYQSKWWNLRKGVTDLKMVKRILAQHDFMPIFVGMESDEPESDASLCLHTINGFRNKYAFISFKDYTRDKWSTLGLPGL